MYTISLQEPGEIKSQVQAKLIQSVSICGTNPTGHGVRMYKFPERALLCVLFQGDQFLSLHL